MARGDWSRAVDLARDYTSRHRDDWRGWLVQGNATLRRGGSDNAYRVAAVIAFRRATQLAPDRPEVWDGYGRAGLELGGADGESIVHDAYERVMALAPLYPGAWKNWLKAYRSRADRERLLHILGRHDSIPEVRAHIAQLLIENEHYRRADALLDSLLRLDSLQPEWLALRAQSAFESGDTTNGSEFYARALAHADRPGGEMLWHQAIGIATPGEIRAWQAGIPASERPGFMRSFWARRNPDLFAAINERIAEHFARLRVARREFQDTHPLSGYENRPLTRALYAKPSIAEQIFYQRCEAQQYPGGPRSAADQSRLPSAMGTLVGGGEDILAHERWAHGIQPPGYLDLEPDSVNIGLLDMPYGRDIRDIDTTAAAMGYNVRTGLDDRGLTYLRFGPPRRRIIGSPNVDDQFCQLPELEHWEYDDIGDVRFFLPEAVNAGAMAGWSTTGDEVYRPMNERQFDATELVMTRDRTSIPAPLQFGVWTAQFADLADSGLSDVLVTSTRGELAAALDGTLSPGDASINRSGMAELHSKPGRYMLLSQAQDSGVLGRQSIPIIVRSFKHLPAVSDMLLAPAWSGGTPTRAGMLAHLQRTLVFAQGSTIRTYLEIYGLRSDSGMVRYQVVYQWVRTDHPERDLQLTSWPGATRLGFQRERAAAPRGSEIETLDIVPAQLPRGRYLLRVGIQDLLAGLSAGYSSIAFEVR